MNQTSPEPRLSGLVFFVLALALYLPTLFWGLPTATAEGRHFTPATDEILPLGALAEMHNTFVESKPDRNYGYPWFHYFATACAQAPYLGTQYLRGELSSPAPAYPYGFEDPVAGLQGLTIAGRLLSVLMAAGTVVLSWRFAAELFGLRVAPIAGALTLTNFFLVYYSGTGNLDAAGAFWVALGFVAFARILRRGANPARMLWLGIFAGLSMATKDQALVVFLPLALSAAWPGWLKREPATSGPGLLRLAGIGLIGAALAYLLGAGMLFDPARHIEHVRRLFFASETLTAGDLYWPPAGRDLAGRMGLVQDYALMWGDVLSWPGLIATFVGAFLVWRLERRVLLGLLPVAFLFVLLAWPMGHAVRRYALPLVLPLDALAAVALCSVNPAGLRRFACAGLIAWKLVLAVDLSFVQWTETRDRVGQKIAALDATQAAGARLEYFGHAQQLPPLPAWLDSRRIMGREVWEGVFDHGPAVLEYLIEEGPELIAIAPDWTSKPGMERSEDCPPLVWNALASGELGYVCVALERPRHFLPRHMRPRLDSRAVSPTVRLFARSDFAERLGLEPIAVDQSWADTGEGKR